MSQKPFRRSVCVATAAVGVLGMIACGKRIATQESPFTEPAGSALLRVENRSFNSAQVYLIWNTTLRIPLGPVEAMDHRVWPLPPRRIADGGGLRNASFRLEARFHPSRDVFQSPVRLLADGSRWVWQLENDMAFATLVVR